MLILKPEILSKCWLTWYGLNVKKRNLDVLCEEKREAAADVEGALGGCEDEGGVASLGIETDGFSPADATVADTVVDASFSDRTS